MEEFKAKIEEPITRENEMEEFKAKIEEFVQSLSKDEPFNGDEVEELGRYFVTELCKQNAEEDQIKHILIDPAGLGCSFN